MKKVKVYKKVLLSCLAIMSIFIAGIVSTSSMVSASAVNFAVIPDMPDNQINQDHGYFELQLDPNQSQTVNVTLKNDTDKDVVVGITMARATTGMSGAVQYSSTSDKDVKSLLDASFKHDIVKAVDVPDKATIPAHSSIQVPINVKMPARSFNGVMAGALSFQQLNLKQEAPENRTAVINQYAYTVGMTLQNKQTPVTPNLKLDGVKAEQINYRTAIVAAIHNTKATYINNVAIDGFISKRNSNHKMYQVNVKADQPGAGKQIAPNSVYNLPFYLGGEPLKPGKYTLDLTMTSHDHKWHFKQNFTIAGKQAQQYNKTDVDIVKINWWLIIGVVLLVLLLIGLFIWLLWHKRKRHHEEEK